MEDFKDLGFEEDFSDLGFEPEETKKSGPKISTTDSFIRGAGEVAAAGFDDEAAGLLGIGLESLPGPILSPILNTILPKSWELPLQSSTQQDEALLKKFSDENKGQQLNLPASPTYSSIRDEDRAFKKEAASQNPNAYLGGGLAMGLATAPLFGTANSVGQAAKLGGAIGAASGLGTSEADLTKGEIGEALVDTAVGGAMGAGLGTLAQAAPKSSLLGAGVGGGIGYATSDDGDELGGTLKGMGIGTLVGGGLGLLPNAVPGAINRFGSDLVTRNYNYQKDTGLNPFNKEVRAKLISEYQSLIDKVKKPFLEKQDEIQNSIKDSKKFLENAEALAKEESSLSKDLAITENSRRGDKAVDFGTSIGRKFQSGYANLKSNIQKTYDELEKTVPEGFKVNINDELQKFKEEARFIGGLSSENADNFFNRSNFSGYDFENMDLAQLRAFRDMMETQNPGQGNIAKAFSNLEKALDSKRTNSLNSSGLGKDFSKRLKDNDRLYAKSKALEKNFIGDVTVNKNTGVDYGKRGEESTNSKLFQTMKDFLDMSSPDRKQKSDDFLKQVYELDPELAKQFQDDMSNYVSEMGAVKNFTPAVQSTEEILSQNPEVTNARNILETIKNMKFNNDAEKIRYTNNPSDVDNAVRSNLIGINDVEEGSKQQEYLKSMLKQYEDLKGNDITSEAKKTVEGVVLGRNQDINLPGVAMNPANQVLNIAKSGVTERAAGAYGRIEGNIERSRVGHVNKVLTEAAEKGKPALDAMRFDLLQQSAFRNILKERETNNEEEKEK